jgi:hypothetical protein
LIARLTSVRSIADHKGNRIVFTNGLSTLSNKASSLIWLRPAQQNIVMSVSIMPFVVQKGDDVIVPHAPFGGKNLDYRRTFVSMRAPDVRPRGLNGWAKLQHADVSRLRLRLHQKFDSFSGALARDHAEDTALQLRIDWLVPVEAGIMRRSAIEE